MFCFSRNYFCCFSMSNANKSFFFGCNYLCALSIYGCWCRDARWWWNDDDDSSGGILAATATRNRERTKKKKRSKIYKKKNLIHKPIKLRKQNQKEDFAYYIHWVKCNLRIFFCFFFIYVYYYYIIISIYIGIMRQNNITKQNKKN